MFSLIRHVGLGAVMWQAVSASALGVTYTISTSPNNTNSYLAQQDAGYSYVDQAFGQVFAGEVQTLTSSNFLRFETETDGAVFAVYNVNTVLQQMRTYEVGDFDDHYLTLSCVPCTAPAGDSWTDVTFRIDSPFDVTSYVSFQSSPGYLTIPRTGAAYAIYAAATVNGVDTNGPGSGTSLSDKLIEVKTDSMSGGFIASFSFFSRTAYRNVSTRTELVTLSNSVLEQRVPYTGPVPSIPEPESAALGLMGIATAVAMARRKSGAHTGP